MNYHIRPLAAEHLADFAAHFARHREESGRDDIHFMPFAPGSGDGPMGIDRQRYLLPLSEPGWQRWFVAWHDTQVVGHVDLKQEGLRTSLHRCELGIGIEREHRAQGLGAQLMQTAIDFVRQTPSIAWLDLRVFAHNQRALKLYRRLGFVELGIHRDRFRIAGDSIDDITMTLDVRT